MPRNFKIRSFFLLFLFLFLSCKNKITDKEEIAINIINDNFEILMEEISFYKRPPKSDVDKEENKPVYLIGSSAITSDSSEPIEKFRKKFNLENKNIEPFFFLIKNIPQNKIKEHHIQLLQGDNFDKIPNKSDIILVEFANVLIDDSHKFASINVIMSIGIAAISEIYYFKKIKNKWVFCGKELLYLG
ncbi:MAG: hypothetical protein LBE36_08965 [Flavobacteriaceae bacterium]|jgi:hypothetical protein|nr:hypothetical protein [Flavobacteriaceae bacterium]